MKSLSVIKVMSIIQSMCFFLCFGVMYSTAKAQDNVQQKPNDVVTFLERNFIHPSNLAFQQSEKSILLSHAHNLQELQRAYDENFVPHPQFCSSLEDYFQCNVPVKGHFSSLIYRPQTKKKIDFKSKFKLKFDVAKMDFRKGDVSRNYKLKVGVRLNKISSNLINFSFSSSKFNCPFKCLK